MNTTTAQFTVKDILRTEVAPALGCTEPIAIALAASAAAALLEGATVASVEIWVDPNIYKNGIAVVIPGTRGHNGLDLAAALGALGGVPELRLQVLESLDDQIVSRARKLVRDRKVRVNLLQDRQGLFIRAAVKAGNRVAECTIRDMHDNIVSLKLDGEEAGGHPLIPETSGPDGKTELQQVETWLKALPLARLIELLDDLDEDDLKFLEEGVQHNLRLADYGLKHGSGLGIGKTLDRLVRQRMMKRDMGLAARILTATAGITYLLGGDRHHIAGAITNLTEDLAGVICDGAKAGCSLKLATAAGTAVQAALFALQGVHVQATDGIISTSPEKTMVNVGILSSQGMIETDRTILKIMLEKQFSDL